MAKVAKVRGIEKLSEDELYAAVKAAESLQMDPSWLFAIMSFESGLSPRARNAASNATGLIQFMPSTARNMGTDIQSLANMSFIQQLEYVKRYFAPYAGKMKSVEDAYLVVFYPAAIKMNPDDVIARKGQAVYDQNAGFDKQQTGELTRRMITNTITGVLRAGENAGYIEVGPPSGQWKTPIVVILILGGSYFAYKGYMGKKTKELAERAVHEAQAEYDQVKDLVGI